MSMMGGRPRGGREHSVEEACPEEGAVKTQSTLEPSRGGLLEPPRWCPHPAAPVVPGSPRETTLAAFPAFPSVVFALTSVSLGVVGAGTAPGGRLAMRACRAGWAAGLSAHSRQLQAVAASVLRGTGRRGGWTAASGLSAELQGHGAIQWDTPV